MSHLADHSKRNKAMNQSELEARTPNPRQTRENARKPIHEWSLIGRKTVYLF